MPRNTSTLPAAIDPYRTLRPWNERPMSRHWLSAYSAVTTSPAIASRCDRLLPAPACAWKRRTTRREDEDDAEPAEESEDALHG